MNKYLRNKNFLYLSISLATEFILSFVLVLMLLIEAQHYGEHVWSLAGVAIALAAVHAFTIYFSTYGLLTVDRAMTVTLPKPYQKATYWNSIICGFLFYPVFIAWYAYRHSGFAEEEINEFTKKYIYKHFELVSGLTEVAEKLDNNFKVEHENVNKLIESKHLTSLEGHKYLFDYLFDKGIVTESLLKQVEDQNIEKIIEDAN